MKKAKYSSTSLIILILLSCTIPSTIISIWEGTTITHFLIIPQIDFSCRCHYMVNYHFQCTMTTRYFFQESTTSSDPTCKYAKSKSFTQRASYCSYKECQEYHNALRDPHLLTLAPRQQAEKRAFEERWNTNLSSKPLLPQTFSLRF